MNRFCMILLLFAAIGVAGCGSLAIPNPHEPTYPPALSIQRLGDVGDLYVYTTTPRPAVGQSFVVSARVRALTGLYAVNTAFSSPGLQGMDCQREVRGVPHGRDTWLGCQGTAHQAGTVTITVSVSASTPAGEGARARANVQITVAQGGS